ncbi:hypothetical protein Micbo1qcDRAFT_222917 [Microdochium bolleyi]|uniref:Mid2 domain-containing protein n=1 Tax=Microdochium bolleyi TaxID=196109 RepID=A0A136J7X4_9PEZI|nr:hypothetical protein Micbo1qcDRAFT_222917 [Microdochium bolleyi]
MLPILLLLALRASQLVQAAARRGTGLSPSTAVAVHTQMAATNVDQKASGITTGPGTDELRRREFFYQGNFLVAPDSMCGYVGGDTNRPWSCGTGDNLIRKCTASTGPYCGTLTFFSGIVDYACRANFNTTLMQMETTSSDQTYGVPLSTLAIGLTAVHLVPPSYGSSSSIDRLLNFPSTIHALPTQEPVFSPESDTPMGAIIGGALGGFAALVLLGIGVCLFLRRRRGSGSRPRKGVAEVHGHFPSSMYSTPSAATDMQLGSQIRPQIQELPSDSSISYWLQGQTTALPKHDVSGPGAGDEKRAGLDGFARS